MDTYITHIKLGECHEETLVDVSGQSFFHGKVLPLTDAEFDENVSNDKVILFYAKWCPHCVAFKDEYSILSTEINIPFYAVEDTDRQLITKIIKWGGIEFYGFPTLIVYSNKKVKQYNSEMEHDSIYKFITETVIQHEKKEDQIYLVSDGDKNIETVFYETCGENMCSCGDVLMIEKLLGVVVNQIPAIVFKKQVYQVGLYETPRVGFDRIMKEIKMI
jgi:thiol-disulfide isomerase/thioredoxin